MTIEELLEIEEIKQIRNLYSHYYDGCLLDELVDLFTDDAICEFGPEFGGDWIGKDQIRTNYAEHIGNDSEGGPHEVMHAVTNHTVTLTGPDTAKGRAYLLDLRTKVGVENPLILFGIYDEVYKKIDGKWKVHRTRIDFLWPNRIMGEERQAAE